MDLNDWKRMVLTESGAAESWRERRKARGPGLHGLARAVEGVARSTGILREMHGGDAIKMYGGPLKNKELILSLDRAELKMQLKPGSHHSVQVAKDVDILRAIADFLEAEKVLKPFIAASVKRDGPELMQ